MADNFFEEKIKKIFSEKKSVIDIGGGLRISPDKGNRYRPENEWIRRLAEKVEYKILDPVPDYCPDIIGDIHDLPFSDDSQEAIICMAVLEHVENPFRAAAEIRRVLKPGGYALIYIPFLFYYHAESGYYKDYWRFTKDGVDLLFKDFSRAEKQSVRGAFETWIKLSPLGRLPLLLEFAALIDRLTGKNQTAQASGYNVFLVK